MMLNENTQCIPIAKVALAFLGSSLTILGKELPLFCLFIAQVKHELSFLAKISRKQLMTNARS